MYLLRKKHLYKDTCYSLFHITLFSPKVWTELFWNHSLVTKGHMWGKYICLAVFLEQGKGKKNIVLLVSNVHLHRVIYIRVHI